MSEQGESPVDYCECGRGPVAVAAFKRNTSLLIRRMGDMGYPASPDWRCIDCVADMAQEVADCPIRPFHRDFASAPTPAEYHAQMAEARAELARVREGL